MGSARDPKTCETGHRTVESKSPVPSRLVISLSRPWPTPKDTVGHRRVVFDLSLTPLTLSSLPRIYDWKEDTIYKLGCSTTPTGYEGHVGSTILTVRLRHPRPPVRRGPVCRGLLPLPVNYVPKVTSYGTVDRTGSPRLVRYSRRRDTTSPTQDSDVGLLEPTHELPESILQ